MRARVYVTLKPSVFDPQGRVVAEALHTLGYGDVRDIGSGNIGATNVLRTGNKALAAATLLLDALKGFLPVLLVEHFSFELGFEDTTIAFVGVAAFLGQL